MIRILKKRIRKEDIFLFQNKKERDRKEEDAPLDIITFRRVQIFKAFTWGWKKFKVISVSFLAIYIYKDRPGGKGGASFEEAK